MRQRRATKGLTLVELIVSLSILVVVMVFCSMLFVTSWRRFQMTCAMQDAQNNAMTGIDHFTRDFNETSCFNINNNTDKDTAGFIFFPSPRDKTGSYNITAAAGDPDWKTWIIYYLYTDPQAPDLFVLVRKQKDWNILNTPTVHDTEDRNGVIVAKGVEKFWVVQSTVNPDSYYFYTAEIWTKRDFRGNTYKYRADHSFIFNDLLQR